MGNVKAIENAVESLPPLELAEFRRWFAEFDGIAWDRQIERDAASGSLMDWRQRRLPTIAQVRRESFEAHRIKAFLAMP